MSRVRRSVVPTALISLSLLALMALPRVVGANSPTEAVPTTLRITDAWARLQPRSSRMSGAYLEIENTGDQEDVLISASCDCAKKVELHVMEEKDGMMKMRHVERFGVAPHSSKKLAPGGAHLMLMGLTAPLSVDRAIEIELVFERAGKIRVSVPVKDTRQGNTP